MNEPAIRALIAKWRREAGPHLGATGDEAEIAYGKQQCADELEALLAAGEAAETPRELDEPHPNWCPKCGAPREVCNAYGMCWPKPEAASLSPAVPPQEDERVIPPFLHPGYVIRKAKPQPHHGIDCGCADCAIPSTAETPPATDKP